MEVIIMVTGEQNERLKLVNELAFEAKRRVLFFYANVPDIDNDMFQKIVKILDNLNFGMNCTNDIAAAHCEWNGRNIEVNPKRFFNIESEEQIGVLIHEINHAISISNDIENGVEPTLHKKIIEEGLADVMAELIVNYYYDNSGIEISNKLRNFNLYTCGYPFNRSVLKTALSIFKIGGNDMRMLMNYYFGNKELFYLELEKRFGTKFYEFLANEENENDYEASFELFEEPFNEEMQKNDFSIVYLKSNVLIANLRISYFTTKLLSKFDVENIDANMIHKIYSSTNGLLKKITSSGYVPEIVDKLIINWVNNSNEEDFSEIYKIIPNVNYLNDCKYFLLRIEKRFGKKIDFAQFEHNDMEVLFNFLNESLPSHIAEVDIDELELSNLEEEEQQEIISSIPISYPSEMLKLLVPLYDSITAEQRQNLNVFKYWDVCDFFLDKNTIFDVVRQEFKRIFNEDFSTQLINMEMIKYLIENHFILLKLIFSYNVWVDEIVQMLIQQNDISEIYALRDSIPFLFPKIEAVIQEWGFAYGITDEQIESLSSNKRR